jgi:hypothetical protein
MKERILQLVEEIRNNLNEVDDAGIEPRIMQEIMDNLTIIEEELYNDDIASYGFNSEDDY